MIPLSTHADVRRLAAAIRHVEQGHVAAERPGFSSGVPELDAILPGGGFARGTILEWLDMNSAGPSRVHASLGHGGGGATLLAVLAATQACRDGGAFVVIDRDQQFYPPAAAAWGIPLARTILLRPTNSRDADWALDQTLRTPGVAAVLDWPRKLDPRAQRRLQLAAETCGVVGLLVRNAAAAKKPSWAKVRLAASRPAAESAGDSTCKVEGTQRATECLMTNDQA